MDKETIRRSKALLRYLRDRVSNSRGIRLEESNTTFGGLYPGNNQNQMVYGSVCIGSSGHWPAGCQAFVHLLYPRKAELKSTIATSRAYWRWLFNDSPWATVFITKSVNEAIKLGVIMRTDVPGNLLMGAAIILREPWAQYHKIGTWGVLSKYFDKTLSFYLCSEFQYAHRTPIKGKVFTPCTFSATDWGINPKGMTRNDVKRFLKGKIIPSRLAKNFEISSKYSPYVGGPERTRIINLFNVRRSQRRQMEVTPFSNTLFVYLKQADIYQYAKTMFNEELTYVTLKDFIPVLNTFLTENRLLPHR